VRFERSRFLEAPLFRPIPGAGVRPGQKGERPLTVTNLYIKRKHGAALEDVTTFAFDKKGIGGGVACMHYLGMWALELPGRVAWDLPLIIASIVLGMVLGMAALAAAVRWHYNTALCRVSSSLNDRGHA